MRLQSRPQPRAPPPACPGSERLHIWKACPPRPTGGRTSGNTCSPPWEWSSLPRGRKGRRRGRRASLTSVGCRCADGVTARRPQLVWTGRGPGEPSNEIPPVPPAAPAPPLPPSCLVLFLLPPLRPRGHFGGPLGWRERRESLGHRLGGLDRAPLLHALTPTCLSSSCPPSGLSPRGGAPPSAVSPAPQCCRRCSGFWDQSPKPSSSSSSGPSEGFGLRLKEQVLRAGPDAGQGADPSPPPRPQRLPLSHTLGSKCGRPHLPQGQHPTAGPRPPPLSENP